MKKEKTESKHSDDLRRQAEDHLKEGQTVPSGLKTGNGEDAMALVHELQVHQIELEIQNEELKRAKLETEDALSKYSDLYDFAPIGLFAIDPKGFIQEINLAGATLLGVERRNLMKKHFRLFVTPKDRLNFDAFCKSAFETSIKQTCELNLQRAGGPTVYARMEGIAAEDCSRTKKECRIVVIDITERKRMEETLREREAELRLVADGVPLLLSHISSDLEYIFANQSYADWFNLPKSEIVGRHISEILSPEGYKSSQLSIEKVLAGEKTTYNLVVQKDGHPRTLEITLIPQISENGAVQSYYAITQDITERKQMEKELRKTRDYLENLINYANAPIIVWDRSFRITRFNHSFERLTGLRAADALGTHLNNLFPDSSRKESMDLIVRTLSGERWEAVEIPVLRTDGSVRTVLWNSANIYDKDGMSVVSTIAQGQDITERKWVEEELRKTRDELELRVQERTSELQSALEKAEGSVRAKAAFLANMSHELRTPLNAVIGFSSLLLDDNLTQEQKEDIESIRKGGEALLVIIDDILEFSRVEKRKIEPERQPLSLKHCIEESLDMVAVQSLERGLNLSYTIKYGTPDTIIGDHGRIRQILVNLLSNAVKFTDEGYVSLLVSSKAIEGNRHQIFLEVKDTGIGIPEDKMNEIFEPFTQVERTLSRKREGVGLGLAITKNLVELIGGRIWAESLPGQGTTFSFTIPAETMPGKQLDIGNRGQDIAFERFPWQKPMRVLVAEDNPSNQRVLAEMLNRLGCRTDAVGDGKEVIQALGRKDYDMVLMDIRMPEMDGITTTKVIRKLRPENRPKIVAITAFALDGDREKCIEAGMDDYIAKPVLMGELADVLRRHSPEIQ